MLRLFPDAAAVYAMSEGQIGPKVSPLGEAKLTALDTLTPQPPKALLSTGREIAGAPRAWSPHLLFRLFTKVERPHGVVYRLPLTSDPVDMACRLTVDLGRDAHWIVSLEEDAEVLIEQLPTDASDVIEAHFGAHMGQVATWFEPLRFTLL